MKIKRLLQDENFSLMLGGQAFILFVVISYFLFRDPPKISPYTVVPLLLFNLLIWTGPTGIDHTSRWLGKHLYLTLQTLFLLPLLIQDFLFSYLFLFLLGQAVMMFSLSACLPWVCLFVAITLWANFFLHSGDIVEPPARAFMTLSFFFFTGFVAKIITILRHSQMRVDNLLAELSEAYLSLQNYTQQAESLAVAEERNRLSKDLHDSIGHRLTTSIVHLEAMLRLFERQEQQRIPAMIEAVRDQLTQGLQDLRSTLHDMYTYRFSDSNLTHSLQQLADDFAAATGTSLNVQLPDEIPPLLSDSQRITIYRAAQEALTNTQKHADAQSIWLTLRASNEAVLLTVRNDGRDFSPPSNSQGYGLAGLQERATQLGGTLQVSRPEAGGTELSLNLPLQLERNLKHVPDNLSAAGRRPESAAPGNAPSPRV